MTATSAVAPNYQRAFSTLGCPEANLDEVLRLAHAFALSAVELRMLENSIQLPELWRQQDVRPHALAERFRQAGIAVPAVDTSLRLIGNSDADRAEFLSFVPFAEALGTRYLRVFDGGKEWNAAAAASARATLEWWNDWKRAQGCAVEMMIETHDSLLTAEVLRDFLQLAPDCGILWDTHHTWRKGRESPQRTWNTIKSNVVHLHVKDSVTNATGGFDLTLPGAGEFPMAELRALLAEARWTGTVSLEWEKGWHRELPPLGVALESCRDWW